MDLQQNQALKGNRIAGLDAVRALLALLGIILHSAISYMIFFPHANFVWYGVSQHNSLFFDWLTFWIHAFRMPAFFFLSGFFSYLIFKKMDLSALFLNRTKRIAIPLFILIFAPVIFGLLIQVFSPNKFPPFSMHIVYRMIRDLGTFWFLYYLFLLDLTSFACLLMYKGLKAKTPGFIEAIKVKTNNRAFYTLCILSIILFPVVVLFFSSEWITPTTALIVPNLKILIYYGLFFLLGWHIQTRFNFLLSFAKRNCYYLLLLSFSLSLPYLFLFYKYQSHGNIVHILALLFYSVAGFSMLLALMGFCLKKFTSNKRYIRYLADSSYWMYLCQIPLIMMVEHFLASTHLPLFEKYLITISIVTALCLLTYQLLIRNRKIFRYIDGNRKPKVAVTE